MRSIFIVNDKRNWTFVWRNVSSRTWSRIARDRLASTMRKPKCDKNAYVKTVSTLFNRGDRFRFQQRTRDNSTKGCGNLQVQRQEDWNGCVEWDWKGDDEWRSSYASFAELWCERGEGCIGGPPSARSWRLFEGGEKGQREGILPRNLNRCLQLQKLQRRKPSAWILLRIGPRITESWKLYISNSLNAVFRNAWNEVMRWRPLLRT